MYSCTDNLGNAILVSFIQVYNLRTAVGKGLSPAVMYVLGFAVIIGIAMVVWVGHWVSPLSPPPSPHTRSYHPNPELFEYCSDD